MNLLLTLIFFIATLIPVTSYAGASEAEVTTQIISQSIQQYPGSCSCPYSRVRNGSRCGKRSAHSRRGSYAPKCFADDISKQEIEAYKNLNEGQLH